MLQTLEVAYGPQTAVIWLSRPDELNVLDRRMIAELAEAYAVLGQDTEVRAIVLAGKGPAFCGGVALDDMRGARSEADERADALALATLLQTIDACPKPTIARIHGACLACGIGLATACDIAVAAHGASFGLTQTRLGLIPAVISPYVLRAMGARAAGRWFLTGETFDASEAWRIGVVHELCEEDLLDAQINTLLGSFMLTAPGAVASSKRLIREIGGRPVTRALVEDTAARFAAQCASGEGREGIASLLEKRRAAWVPEIDEAQ